MSKTNLPDSNSMIKLYASLSKDCNEQVCSQIFSNVIRSGVSGSVNVAVKFFQDEYTISFSNNE